MDRREVPYDYGQALSGAQVFTAPFGPLRCLELDRIARDAEGELRSVPASVYAPYDQRNISYWCVERGYYSLPTDELVAAVADLIDGRRAIEVGAGHGALGHALGIPTTDSYQQTDPGVIEHYARIQQEPVHYGSNVERLTAMQAVEKYEPEVVVGCWVTHKANPARPKLGGNMRGIDEQKLLSKKSVRRYIFVGHERVHATKPLLSRRHTTHKPSGMHGRPMDRENHVIWVWDA